jgi:hypothetical protein
VAIDFMAGSSAILTGEAAAMAEPTCKHKRTQVIAKDNDAHYVECLDCGEILEVGEIKIPGAEDESLSDA